MPSTGGSNHNMEEGSRSINTSGETALPPGSAAGSEQPPSAGSAQPAARQAAHSDDDSGCALEEYTWVPPGLKPDQVGLDS
jgi:hypothetical protein